MKTLKLIFTVASLLTYSQFGAAAQSDYDINYDGIVSELSQSRGKVDSYYDEDPFDKIKLHGGVGIVTSIINLGLENSDIAGLHSGVEANFGIDLFSERWMAEGSVRSFGEAEIDGHNISLKEFDLKLTNHNRLGRALQYRAGFGLAARYLDYLNPQQVSLSAAGKSPTKYTTPASIFYFGVNAVLSKTVTLGIEAAYRSPMISETIETGAFDTGLKVDFHF